VIGTLGVLDQRARTLPSDQLDALRIIGRQIVAQLELQAVRQRAYQPDAADAPGFLAELVGLLIDDLPGRLDAIANGIARADAPGTSAAAHSLKGSAANLGAKPLASLCQRLEAAGKAGSLDAAEVLLEAIRTEAERARLRLEREIRPAA